MYIAKMNTRYPEYHGSGYYNFIMEEDRDILDEKIEDNSNDFALQKIVKTRHHSVEVIITQYPTKDKLNERYFK